MFVSAVQQSESAIRIHIAPPSWASLPPLPHSTPPGHHRALSWAPCVVRQLPLALYFMHGSVYLWVPLSTAYCLDLFLLFYLPFHWFFPLCPPLPCWTHPLSIYLGCFQLLNNWIEDTKEKKISDLQGRRIEIFSCKLPFSSSISLLRFSIFCFI